MSAKSKSPEDRTAATVRKAARVEKQLASLTGPQASRAALALAGASPAQIARAEGVSRQAVVETLAAPAIRGALREIDDKVKVIVNGDKSKPLTGLELAYRTTLELCVAERAVVLGGGHYEMQSDNAVRHAAAETLFRLHGLGYDGPRETPVETEETVTVARRRRSR